MNVKLQADLWSAAVSQHELFFVCFKSENGDGKMMYRCGADTARPCWVKQIQGRGTESEGGCSQHTWNVLKFCSAFQLLVSTLFIVLVTIVGVWCYWGFFCECVVMVMFWLKLHDTNPNSELCWRQQINWSEHFRFNINLMVFFIIALFLLFFHRKLKQ